MCPQDSYRNQSLALLTSCWLWFIASTAAAQPAMLVSRVATGLDRPVFATTIPGDDARMFILEQHTGRIQIMDLASGEIANDPLLQVPGVGTGNEQGLLGLAFDPAFNENGYFYVNTANSSRTTVERYQFTNNPNAVDLATATPVISYSQPQRNHNGGWMGFDPTSTDPYLYISSGDGGAGDDQGDGHTPGIGNAQDLTNNLLGKILRIDVSTDAFPNDNTRNYSIPVSNPFVNDAADSEIWAYGLRNAWRSSFDRATGDLYIADVGQREIEEINFQPASSQGGENYGWRLREGSIQTPNVGGPEPLDHAPPIHEYRHINGPDGGFSVTGGYVYRGPIESLRGQYFFSDFVSNQIWSLRHDGNQTTELTNWTESVVTDAGAMASISSFAEDNQGNLYVLSLNGDIFRIDDLTELTTIVPTGSEWAYLDDGSNQGTAWSRIGFDDSTWERGPAELGYGDGDEATVVDFGTSSVNKHETTYFRHEFDVQDPALIDSLSLSLLYDDGAAVYLNGTEIVRANLRSDAAFDDFSDDSRRGEDQFDSFGVDPALLNPGTNLLAVEVHQVSGRSSDLSFDLQLRAVLSNGRLGDFDGDGTLNVNDINALTAAVAVGGAIGQSFDLNGDGAVNRGDINVWVKELRETWIGDSNLDGEFNSVDFVTVFTTGKFETKLNANWSEGDWNGDGVFDTSDFVSAFEDGGFELGPRAALQSVPEPATALQTLLAMLFVGLLRQRRTR